MTIAQGFSLVTSEPAEPALEAAQRSSGSAVARRTELAAFLRACRGRITPEAVGLPPGPRRRTPGLRREEVAQLAGVGVTWYTWLEQGRPINASEQVLEAIARTLKLDGAQRDHLYLLAEMNPAGRFVSRPMPEEVQVLMDSMQGIPVSVANSRFDVLACNDTYRALFPGVMNERGRSNVLWCAFTTPDCCNPFVHRNQELPRLVAMLRGYYGQHIGEPEWEDFIAELLAVSPLFTELWGHQQVAAATSMHKVFKHASAGEMSMTTTSFGVISAPGLRMVAYVPADEVSKQRIGWLCAHPDAPAVDHTH